MTKSTQINYSLWLRLLVVLIVALASLCVGKFIWPAMESPAHWNALLDESRNSVLSLLGGAAASSAAITMLPGDVATPIAEQLAELGDIFMAALCAIYVEKFIISTAGVITFKVLIPAACVLCAIGIFTGNRGWRSFGMKVVCLGVALLLVVPGSLKISEMVKDSYSESIQQVVDSAHNSASQIQESIGTNRDEEEAANGLAKIVKNLQRAGDSIANGASQFVEYLQKLLVRFVEAAAVMVVVSCVIPVLTLLVFAWMVKCLFGIDFVARYDSFLVGRNRKIEEYFARRGEQNHEE